MGSTTRVILPIVLLFGVIFGITFISNNTNTPVEQPKPSVVPNKKIDPLSFGIVNAEPNPNSSNPAIRTMTVDWDIGVTGHFDFWFLNPNKETVQVYLQGKSCTCAGAQLAVVPAASTKRAVELSAIGTLGNPLQSLAMLPFVAGELTRDLKWETMSLESESDLKKIPPAGDLPQLGILRVTYSSSKPGEKKRVTAKLMTSIGNTVALPKELSVVSRVAPTMNFFSPNDKGKFAIEFTPLYPYDSANRDFYLFSFTRSELDVRVSWALATDDHSGFSFTAPQKVTGAEFDKIVAEIDTLAELGPARIRSMYRIGISVQERAIDPTTKQVKFRQQMGPFEKLLLATIGDGTEYNSLRVPIRGIIRGEIRIVSNSNDNDRIDFGKSVNALTGETREVELQSIQPGLDIELLSNLTSPPYLQAEMTLKGEEQGKKSWFLKVRIPPGKLNGTLPTDAAVTIQLKDGSSQRIRIPILGTAIEGGRQL
jgi:hypothetical protein